MPILETTRREILPGRQTMRRRPRLTEGSYLASLEAGSDRPEVQALIRDAVRRGTIRVIPDPKSGSRVTIVRIVPDAIPLRFPVAF